MNPIGMLVVMGIAMVAVFGGISVVTRIYNLDHIKAKTVGDGQHGTARWARPDEIKRVYKHIPYTPVRWREQAQRGQSPTMADGKALPQGLVVGGHIGHDTVAFVDDSDVHALMIINSAYKAETNKKIYILAILATILFIGAILSGIIVMNRKSSYIEDGSKEIILANLVGEKVEVAAEYLNECGIGYKIIEEVRDDIEKGIVLDQSINSYTVVKTGEDITLIVSAGKDYIVSITIEQFPGDLDYCIGDVFDFSGLTLRAVYNSGAEKVISSGFTYSPESASKTGMQYLQEVHLPETLEEIGDGAFWNCSALSSVSFGKVQKIGDFAFQYCIGITEIDIPDTCKSIGEEAFSGVWAAKRIVLPASLSYIGPGAFTGCNNAIFDSTSGSYAEKYLSETGLGG